MGNGEILFKAKRMDNGEWVEGYYLKKIDPLLGTEKCFILNQGDMQSLFSWYQVDPKTVCQYTGLYDRNGNRIFDWDKCRFFMEDGSCSDYGSVVFWDTANGGFSVKENDSGAVDSLDLFYAENCEVIGNIYDMEADNE